MGIRSSKEPNYLVLEDFGNIQIRLYSPLIVAETVITAAYKEAGSIGFNRLAGYIFGGNRQKQELAMTTPVIRESLAQKLDMTIPVLQAAEANHWTMSFIMPAGYDLNSLPEPLDPLVKLKAIPEKKIATLQYSGLLNENRIAEHMQMLSDWLTAKGINPLSMPRSAAYDPPWTIPALRRNEIHIEIE